MIGVGFGGAIKLCFRKYGSASGRAPRSEYWFWTLFVVLCVIVARLLDAFLFGPKLPLFAALANLVLILPGIAVGLRRMHDVDRAGYWILISIVPIVGWIILLIWLCKPGTSGDNRFGSDPLR